MAAERRAWSVLGRVLLLALALVMLADLGAAQGKRHKGGGKKGPRPPQAGGGFNPGSFGGGTGGLPGLGSPGGKKGARGKAPKGPSPKRPAPKPEPPPDPMKEADLVAATAEHQGEVEEAEQKLLREHFRVCDLDGNGWLSLREAEITLALSRDDYRRTDANHDGRIVAAEFAAQKTLFLARLGAQPAPRPKVARAPEPVSAPAPGPTPAEPQASPPERKRARASRSELQAIWPHPSDLLSRYDADHSKGLDAAEIQKLLLEIGLALSAEQLAASMDPNDSGQLEGAELFDLAWIASRHMPESLRPEPPAPLAAEPAAAGDAPADTLPAPAVAPVARAVALTHFGRLDADHDGFVTESDLRALQSPARVDVRLTAVLSILDRDRDGKLSEDEFRASMRATPR